MLRKILISVLILAAIVLSYAFYIYNAAGEMKTIHDSSKIQCRKITAPGISGPEDIVIDKKRGIAYLSIGNWRERSMGKNDANGGIYRYDLNDQNAAPENITRNIAFKFIPHGIDFYETPQGGRYLVAVNHGGGVHSLELFQLDNESAKHIRTIRGALLISPNDVTALDENRFFISNDHGSTKGIGKMSEDYLRRAISNVVYFNGKNLHLAVDGFMYANGIIFDHQNDILMVAETTGKKLNFYQWSAASEKLTFLQSIDIDSGLDNIDLNSNGVITIGAHPKLLTFVRHSKDANVISPSQIIRLSPKGKMEYEIDDLYMNSGRQISGSTTGAQYENRILIGSVFEKFFLDCSYKN